MTTALSDKDKKGIALISVAISVLLILAVVRGLIGEKRLADCSGALSYSTVVILDRSEEMSVQTVSEIRSRALRYINDSTHDGELVSIFSVNAASKSSLAPVLSVCRPPATGNRAVENVKVIQKRFREGFETPVSEALNIGSSNSDESPLTQTLIDLSRMKYLRARTNTLLIFSDMLENTPAFTLYGCDNPQTVISRFRRSRLGAVERPTFTNTRVVINTIPRFGQSAEAVKCRDQLWVWFFGDDSGPSAGLQVDYLPGGPTPSSATRQPK